MLLFSGWILSIHRSFQRRAWVTLASAWLTVVSAWTSSGLSLTGAARISRIVAWSAH